MLVGFAIPTTAKYSIKSINTLILNMKFYRIRISLDLKVVGTYPQVETGIYPIMDNNSNFIGNNYLKKIDFIPELSIPILKKKSKKTDLIGVGIMGFTNALLISEKLQQILEKYGTDNIQFFEAPIKHKDIQEIGYWIVHPYKVNYELVDYSNCIIKRQNLFNYKQTEYIGINSSEEFKNLLVEQNGGIIWSYLIEKLALLQVYQDFFILGGVSSGIGYYVSEHLKNEIEEAGCTGIEFEPVEQG